MRRTGRMAITLVAVLLLVLTIACAPVPGKVTPAPTPAPEEITPTTPPTPEEVTPPPTPPPEEITPTPAGEKVNFRFLISDDVNAIKFFERLDVIISSIGVHQGGESGTWHPLDPLPDPDEDGRPGINLRPLEGPNALVIWEGILPAGDYTKVFIYVNEEDITGVLLDDETVDVKLPSEKLQISKPFTIGEDQVINFIYDITVVKAGESGQYILKPQIAQSGTNLDFNDVTPSVTGGDTTPPVIDLTGVTEGQIIISPDTVTPLFSVLDDTDLAPTVFAALNGQPFTSGTVVSDVGEYELEVTAVDASGNEAELAVNFEIVEVEDTTPPEITLTGVTEGQVIASPDTVTPVFSASDDTDPNPIVVATLNGDEFTSGTEVSEVGVYELIVTAIDASDNEAEVVVNFEIVEE